MLMRGDKYLISQHTQAGQFCQEQKRAAGTHISPKDLRV
jgi:hypothetical protein